MPDSKEIHPIHQVLKQKWLMQAKCASLIATVHKSGLAATCDMSAPVNNRPSEHGIQNVLHAL
jgi:hypothetical protein